MTRSHAALASVLFLAAASPTSARTWYITPDGTGDAPTIQAGVDSSAVGDTVLVACGEYTDCTREDFQATLNCILMKDGIVLRSESGDPSCVTVNAEQAGRCVFAFSIDEPTLIEGFTFTGGHVTVVDGGGMFIFGSGEEFVIRNCVFRDNYTARRGGGLAGVTSRCIIQQCEFLENSAPTSGDQLGGGGAHFGVSWPTLLDCRFERNSANEGAGLYCTGASLIGNLTLERCDFVENESSFRAGGLYLSRAWVDMSACRVLDNLGPGGAGGMLILRGSEIEIRETEFVGNSAGLGVGGALYSADSSVVNVTNCLFSRNEAGSGSTAASRVSATTALLRCTVWDDQTAGGGVLYLQHHGHFVLDRSIFAFHTSAQVADCSDGTGSATFICSDVYGNAGGDWSGCIADQAGLSGNISADPLFCDPDAGDFHLQWGSPCLPASSNGCGLIGRYGFGGCSSVSVTPETWGRVKARFRSMTDDEE